MTKNNPTLAKATILDAACRVFAQNSYTAATIRMIAKEGRVPHALIRYYFSSKANLFDTVAKKICEDLYTTCEEAINEARRMERAQGFSRYVWRLIEYAEKHPWTFRIILLNLSAEVAEEIPGQVRILETVESVRTMLIDALKLQAPVEEVRRFTDSFNTLVFYYLGTPVNAAWLLRLDPESRDYANWVHQTLTSIFLPSLERLFQAE